jgi:hypothetical protein
MSRYEPNTGGKKEKSQGSQTAVGNTNVTFVRLHTISGISDRVIFFSSHFVHIFMSEEYLYETNLRIASQAGSIIYKRSTCPATGLNRPLEDPVG